MDRELEMEMQGWADGGRAVGRAQGMAVFVPGAIPGERLRARITKQHKRFAEAELTELLLPSPDRILPPCPHYAECGGCAMQHIAYPRQLALKRRLLAEKLSRLGGLTLEPAEPVPAPQPWRYRCRARFHVEWRADGPELGFFAEGSHRLVPVRDCLLLPERMNAANQTLRALLEERPLPALSAVTWRHATEPERLLLLLEGGAPADALPLAEAAMQALPELRGVSLQVGDRTLPLVGEERLCLRAAGVSLSLSAGAFSQVNPQLAERLYAEAAAKLALSGRERLLDLYCGAGVFGLSLAGQAASVLGVEEYAPAVADAERNAAANGVENARFLAGRTEDLLGRLAAEGRRFDAAILDPPRAGCRPQALRALSGLGLSRLLYVSCGPASLARDLKLLQADGWRVESAPQPFDLFAQTEHIESVVLITRV